MTADHLSYPYRGWVVWLTEEQGGRSSGPPCPSGEFGRYAATAFVPPATARTGIASFVMRGFDSGAWRTRAEGGWLAPENPKCPVAPPGTVIVVTEGSKNVAYFTVDPDTA